MDLDDRVRNLSSSSARCLVVEDRHGREIALAIVKLTLFVTAAGVVYRSIQRPIRITDELVDPTRPSSLRYPTDVVPEKPGTDVFSSGTTYPPLARRASHVDACLRVVTAHRMLEKKVRVWGPRVWQRAALGGVAPGPSMQVEQIPLVYEHAYGGIDASDPGDVRVATDNPVGSGIARDRAALVGRPAPRLEDPDAPLDSSSPRPAGFGPIAAHWTPRAERAGTFDEQWRRMRAPLWPVDTDPRHFSCAPPGLWANEPLEGGELVELIGATPEGAWRFALPRYGVRLRALVNGAEIATAPHLDTVAIDANVKQVELVWRAAFPMPRRRGDIGPIVVTDEGDLPAGALDPDARALREALAGSGEPHG